LQIKTCQLLTKLAKIFSSASFFVGFLKFGAVGGLGSGGTKLNVVQSVGFVWRLAPLLILLCGGKSSFCRSVDVMMKCRFAITDNEPRIGDGRDF
jgi:hypothetical protein